MHPPPDSHNLPRRAKAEQVSAAGNLVGLHLVGPPAAGPGRGGARTIQGPLLVFPHCERNQIGPVRIWTEADKVARRTLGTLHAMTHTPSHDIPTAVQKVAKLDYESRTETDLDAVLLDVFGR